MANNDRVTRDPTPSWIGDNKSSGKPLATKTTNGTIGWSDVEHTRTLLSRDAFNKPGWRDKNIIPPGMASVDFDTSLFQVTLETTAAYIKSGDLVPLGSIINVYLMSQEYEYGCKTEIVNGSTLKNLFMKNFSTSTEVTPNLDTIQVIGNVQITGQAKKRAHLSIGCQVPHVISATIDVNSWGDKGHQSKTLDLISSWSEPVDMEFYSGDELNIHFEVNSQYHWANFKYGVNPAQMDFVNKSEIIYTENGGDYKVTMSDNPLYMDMSAVKPIKFYLYQPNSNSFNSVKAKVSRLNTDLRIYKNVNQPSVGTNIDFGRNGVARNHVDLYVGMSIEIYCNSSETTYISRYISASPDTLSPALPALPDDNDKLFSYFTQCIVTIPTNSNNTGTFCVGLRYVKPRHKGTVCQVDIPTSDSDIFKNFMDALYLNNAEYFTNKVHRASTITHRYDSETYAERLALVNGLIVEWEYEQRGTFQRGSIGQHSQGGIYDGEPMRALVDYVNMGPFETSMACYVESIKIEPHGSNEQKGILTCVGDGIDVEIAAPTGQWDTPDGKGYIPYDTLKDQWGDQPWRCRGYWNMIPYFAAITGGA